GHLNRRRLSEELAQVLDRAAAKGEPHAYVVAAIDQLGVVNQIHGYGAADEVIAAVGQRLSLALRASDLIGRIAGNKFGIALKLRDDAELARIAAQLHAAASSKPIETQSGAVTATVSIGAVLVPQHAVTTEDAMRRAEEALERARSFGRTGFSVYAPSAQRESARRRLAS